MGMYVGVSVSVDVSVDVRVRVREAGMERQPGLLQDLERCKSIRSQRQRLLALTSVNIRGGGGVGDVSDDGHGNGLGVVEVAKLGPAPQSRGES